MKNGMFHRISAAVIAALIVIVSLGQASSAQAGGTTYTPADVNKSFTPTTISTGGTSQLEIFIYNPNAFQLILSSSPAALSDTLPTNVHFASSVSSNTCGGIVSIVGDTLYLYGGTVPAAGGGTSGNCTITATVTATIPGTYINDIPLGVLKATDPTGTVQIPSAAEADATLTVNTVLPPSLSKSFNPNTMWVGDNSTMTVRIINNDPNTALTEVALTDVLPANITVNSFSASQCGGIVGYAGGELTISGATIAAKPGECDLTATVTSSTPGAYTNSIPASAVQTQQGVTNANAASAPLNVQAIGITKSFTPSNFQASGTTTLNIVLQNPSSTPYTSASLTDNLPAGMAIAGSPTPTNGCGGSLTAATGIGIITLSNGTIPIGTSSNPGNCTISVPVTASVAANYTNTIPVGALTAFKGANQVTNVLPASANVTVYGQGLGVGGSKSFSPSSIQINGNSKLTINLTAPADTDLHSVSLTDSLPTNVTVSNSTPASTSGCSYSSSPTLTANTGAGSISMTNGSIQAGTTCHIYVYVTSGTAGTYTNTISPANISSLDANNNPRDVSGNFTASLTVSGISVSKAYYPTVINDSGISTLTITLTNTNTAELDNVSLTDNNTWGNLTNGIQIAPNPNVNTTCGTPTIIAVAGTQTISMSGGTIPAQVGSVPGICTINVDVTGVGQKASYSNTIPAGGVSGTIHGTSINVSNPSAASATIAVQPISIRVTKDFNPTGVFGGSASTLSVHLLGDPNAPLTGISFTDNLPQKNAAEGMTVADPPNLSTGTCGGTITVSSDGKSFSFSGGSLAANAQCTLSLSVVMNTQDNLTNTICGSLSDNIPEPDRDQLCSKEITAGVGDVTSSNGATNTEAAQATLTNQGGLTVTKAFGPNPITAGGTSQLTITIQNLSNFGLTGVGLINANGDTFPAGLTAVTPLNNPQCGGGTVSWDSANDRLTFSGGSLAALSSCNITVDVTATNIGSYKNCINKSTMTDDQNITNQTDECDTLVVNSSVNPPTIAKSFTPTSIPAGGTSDLAFTIANPNTASLTGIGFTDTLPNNLTLASAPNASQCNGTVSYDGGTNTITLTGGSLAGNSNCKINVGVTGTVGGSYNNQTAAITSNEGGTGSPSNTATLTVVSPPAISKSFSPNPINVGNTSSLTFTLTNPKANAFDLTGVGFTDTFPTGMTIAGSPSASNSCGGFLTAAAGTATITLSNGTIPHGFVGITDGTCTISVPVTASGGIYDNKSGNVSSTEGGIGNTAEDTLTVNGPGLMLTKSTTNAGFQGSGPGGTITYNYVLTNTGNETLYPPFEVTDDHINGSTPFTCNDQGITSINGLASGNSVSCSQTYTATNSDVTAGSVTNTATGTGMDAPTGGNTVTSNQSSATVYLEALTLQKSTTTTGYQNSGATIHYSYTITNTGNVTLYGNDASGKFTITDDHIGTPLGTAFTCGTVTSLAPGANTTCTATYTVPGPSTPSSVTNTATAHGQDKTKGSSNINSVDSNQSSVTVYQVIPPTIAKAFNPAQIPVGSNSTLTFTITNPSTNVIPLTGVSFSDSLPSGMMVANAPVSAQCGGTVTGPVGATSISFSGGTVLPSPNNTCTVSVDVAVAAGGTYNNTSGKVSSTNGGTNNGSSGIATATLTAIAPPTITKAFSPTAVVVFNGVLTPNVDVSTLTFTLTNGNSSQLTGVGFTDNLPAGVAVANPPSVNANLTNCGVSDFSPAATAGATTLTFSNGVIPANSACTISVNVIATTAGTFDNTTSAITSTEGGTGATSNTAILTSNPTADLSLTKTSKDAKGNLTPDVDPGETITYTIVVNNSGPSNVTGAAVSDTIPSSLTGVSWTCAASAGASCASGTNTGNISDTVNIPNGGSLTYTITATVSSTDTTDVINTATVTPPSGVTDTNPGNNSATVVDHLNLLSITKTPSTTTYSAAGTVINYSYTITNVGTSTLTNLSATDNPLGTLTCNSVPASFAPTDSFTCSAFYTTTQGDLDADKTISNSATVSGKDKEGDTVTATSNTVTVTASQTTGLTLTKSVSTISGTSPHQAGDVITYSYVLKNTGNVTLTGTDLTTQEFTIADDHIGAPLGTAFTCGTVISLAPNSSVTCTATYAIAQTDLDNGGVTNKATGYATFQSTPVTSKQVSLTTPLSQSSALSLTKTPSPSAYAYVGDVITYTYTLKNTGNVTLAGADSTTHEFTITDDHIGTPLGTAFTCGTVTSLAPDATVMCTNTYDIVSSDLTDGSVTNQATGHAMSGTTPVDASPVKATATAQLATIAGTVFDDVNTNGNQDANETGIAGVTVDLYDSTGTTLIATTTTDSKGHYSFIKLPASNYTVVEKDLAGYVSTTSNTVSVTAPPNGTAQANFGDYQIAGCSTNSITGVVFVDANDNGVFDAGEQGIPGVTVTLEDQNNHVVASTTTASNGSYSFNNISAGLYTVVETNLPGYFSTTLDHVGVAISCNTSDVVNYGDLQGTETFTGDPAVSKYGDPSSATVGSLVTFTITVGNNGPNNAQNVNLTDTAPTFLDIISINILPNQNFPVTIAGDTFTIKFGTVTPQNYYIVTVVTRVNNLGSPPGGANNASISTTTTPEPTFNDSASVYLNIPSHNHGGGGGLFANGGPLPPLTGFAPGQVTLLPVQPEDRDYQDLGDLWLEIPRLKVKIPIVGIPLNKDDSWDLTWLGDQAGYLDGTAYPTHDGNSVITAHVYMSNGLPGPFVNLSTLKWGDQIIIHLAGQQYIYEVQENNIVSPTDSSAFKHEDQSWLTLITCKDYNASTNTYAQRVVVGAGMIKVEPDTSSNGK